MRKRTKDVKKQILDTLDERGGLSWSDLLERARVSRGALSRHLNDLVKAGFVKRDVDANTRPPTVTYALAEASRKYILKVIGRAEGWKNRLKEMKKEDRSQAESFVENVLMFNFLHVIGLVVNSFYTETLIQGSAEEALKRLKVVMEYQIKPSFEEMLKFSLSDPDLAKPVTDSIFQYIRSEQKKCSKKIGEQLGSINLHARVGWVPNERKAGF